MRLCNDLVLPKGKQVKCSHDPLAVAVVQESYLLLCEARRNILHAWSTQSKVHCLSPESLEELAMVKESHDTNLPISIGLHLQRPDCLVLCEEEEVLQDFDTPSRKLVNVKDLPLPSQDAHTSLI